MRAVWLVVAMVAATNVVAVALTGTSRAAALPFVASVGLLGLALLVLQDLGRD